MNLSWCIRRLRVMRPGEVVYRISQRRLQCREKLTFRDPVPVHEVCAYGEPPSPVLSNLGLNLANKDFTASRTIELLGGYSYDEYRMRWHAAFQSEVDWPIRFAYDYSFGAEGVPGDIRTNWELNRHHQFAVLAKSYLATGEKRFLNELSELFEDWNRRNPFLWGPEWTSPMEVVIRLVNWLVAAALLNATPDASTVADELCNRLANGSWVMAACVRQHYSRYSSANNHTIVEAAGVGIAAVVFGEEEWLSEAISILEEEVVRQTWSDGVNKEQALHYQLFVMEALCLLLHVVRASRREFSMLLVSQIRSMAAYVRACSVGGGRYVEFGDDDEGRLLNLSPFKTGYPDYVLSLVSLECGGDCRWVQDAAADETVRWLYSESRLEAAGGTLLEPLADIESFPDGGVTILRSDKSRITLAFDHGPLGLDPLAAHGHADALSVQLYVDGEPVLVDSGTYIYNGDQKMRDLFRSTAMHNTVCINGRNQSEMLGSFLWGRKAKVGGAVIERNGNAIRVSASHDGYAPVIHKRIVTCEDSKIAIVDEVGSTDAEAIFLVLLPVEHLDSKSIVFETSSGRIVHIETTGVVGAEKADFSPEYGRLGTVTKITVAFSEVHQTVFRIEEISR